MKYVKNNHPFGNTSLINWIFDDVLTKDAFNSGNNAHSVLSALNKPSTNITEDENSFTLEIAAPGLEKKDFSIDLKENAIHISAKKEEEEKENNKKNYKSREFNFSSFKRSFRLPENTDIDHISAEYIHGILHVTLPKKENAKKTVEIQIK